MVPFDCTPSSSSTHVIGEKRVNAIVAADDFTNLNAKTPTNGPAVLFRASSIFITSTVCAGEKPTAALASLPLSKVLLNIWASVPSCFSYGVRLLPITTLARAGTSTGATSDSFPIKHGASSPGPIPSPLGLGGV